MSGLARANTGTVIGVEAHSVTVEAHRAKGLPGLTLIGLARGAVRESVVRVRSAILASGLSLGTQRSVVNLLPAELPKEASALDLPLAIALLAASGLLDIQALDGRRFFGELSLGGRLEPVRGGVLLADLVRRRGERELIVPTQNATEAAVIPGVQVIGAESLADVIAHLDGSSPIPPTEHQEGQMRREHPCLSDVRGQSRAKRALEIAAAGGHNILMLGPPGSGKTMLARRLAGLLPHLACDERIEVTRIHSAAGEYRDQELHSERPFRAPHHSASEVALCGGGTTPRPGEITLAHRGVLFLDELPEYSRRALEALREPLEDGSIRVARAAMSVEFPAEVLLVAAMNPCPCGYYRGDLPDHEPNPGTNPCLCSFESIQRYRSKISGPLLDRIDLHVCVDAVAYRDFSSGRRGEGTELIRSRVERARATQRTRLGPAGTNATMGQRDIERTVHLTDDLLTMIEVAISEYGLSTRAVARCLKVARTIADLAGVERVSAKHLREALGLRLLGRTGLPRKAYGRNRTGAV